MPEVHTTLYLEGTVPAVEEEEWELLGTERYEPEASTYEGKAEIGTFDLSWDFPMFGITAFTHAKKVAEEACREHGVEPMELRYYITTGSSALARIEIVAHASPFVIPWAAIGVWMLANWLRLSLFGLLAVAFVKVLSVIWKAGEAVEEIIEEYPEAVVGGLGLGLLLLGALFIWSRRE